LLKQKMSWGGIAIVLVVLIVFGAAMMGSVLGSKPKDLPVALVQADQGASLPTGGTLEVGKMIAEKLTSNPALPFKWEVVDSAEAAEEGLRNREYYGALVLPADLSRGLLTLASTGSEPPTVRILANDGLNAQAATVVKQVLGQGMSMAGSELSKQLLELAGQAAGGQVPVAAAQALLAPVQVQEASVNPVGANNANGNAPGLLTQIMWVGSLVIAMTLFLANQKALASGGRSWSVKAVQAAAGLAIAGLASGFLVWMASSWYGMELEQTVDVWLALWLAASTFFLLQSSLLNWLGLPAMAILVLLMFFSMPVLNMAPEFLSRTTQDWIYSWTPLRFAAGALRETMYFGGLDGVGSDAVVLWSASAGFLALLLVSGAKKAKSAPVSGKGTAPAAVAE